MRIEELIIEGFKSYAARTHITGWDFEFNAITGLNGSGKSNILDAICFVLGITNLTHVRASNLQDLIYKRGQAGITKASVTIVFNNEDREGSPIGYEQYKQITVTRQVLIGGKTKYIVNGHTAQQQVVANLFQSVQLNVNNPHFLIMQGKITKVLNMKPPEILAMIEEAAGTRMFEERKDKAFKTMAKKETKVVEITSILNEEIGPKLQRLREEKRAFLEFQKVEIEIDRLRRLVVAYDYMKNEEQVNRNAQGLDSKQERLEDLEKSISQLKREIKNIDVDLQRHSKKKQREMSNGGKFQELEEAVKEYSKQLVKTKTVSDLKAKSVAEETKKKDELLKNLAELEQSLKEKQEEHEKKYTEFEEVKNQNDRKTNEVKKSEELIQTLSTGVAAQEGHENGYMEQLQEAKNIASQSSTEEEQTKLRISHMKKELKELQPKTAKAKKENSTAIKELEAAQQQIKKLESQIQKLNWDPDTQAKLLKEKSELKSKIDSLEDEVETMSSKLSGLEFQYADPTPNFDRSQVKGLVAELINVEDEQKIASTALEICAGGRLYNVVVDTEVVGKQLLQKGKLRRRVTIIPLNKIAAFKASAEKIATAQKLAPGKVDLALNLIGYDDEVTAAMQFVFGNTLICRDAKSAEKVTFDKNVRMKSVTYDGDVYDPSGTLQGGSKPSSGGILMKMNALKEAKMELASLHAKLDSVNKKLQALQQEGAKYKEAKQQLDLKIHAATLLEEQLSKSSHAQVLKRAQDLENEVQDLEKAITQCREKRSDALKRVKELEVEMEEFKENKDSKLEDMRKKLSNAKKTLSKSTQVVKNMQREVQTMQLEIEQTEAEISSCRQQISDADQSIEEYSEQEKTLKEELIDIKNALDNAQDKLDREMETMKNYDSEIRELEALSKSKAAEMADSQLELQKLSHELERYDKERETAARVIAELEKAHEWIVDQKQFFGKENTPYDFEQHDVKDAQKKLKKLELEHDKLRKKINMKVMNTMDSVEKKEAALKHMLHTVRKDKRKIEETIKELDNYKKEALERTWKKVNVDFGAIFGELLQGNSAKLEPPENQTLMEGLEVKVCLGGVWKQSLTELSGGQRSLIALSLILALLQFKPAPMYILDEIDAALDLSHTQNIGQLFRSRFKGSQFIVVSLKEGMFNNANVLFRARFRDGISMVERHAQKQSRTPGRTSQRPSMGTPVSKPVPRKVTKRARVASDS
ncbi:putative SMC2 protein [Basidiobolus meristosporus CBS 931.73]|uniref:Structural maintenance of chromosomes protein n=1 Tax=Basidiobolus meristosporus CBS 931.73 TaxID=1314790 RepID=A0A1Y1Z368_9FUNG|nr:putative SMC2 protein [Basidiobolus meristosporus CBS 931.73]|eukprot:ORY04728.1 putative SMC2 protein [Basidiobolus meristosporus CBS 931.73]